MRANESFGSCPLCGATVIDWDLLIKYEPEDGQPIVSAECPDCGEVISPQ